MIGDRLLTNAFKFKSDKLVQTNNGSESQIPKEVTGYGKSIISSIFLSPLILAFMTLLHNMNEKHSFTSFIYFAFISYSLIIVAMIVIFLYNFYKYRPD